MLICENKLVDSRMTRTQNYQPSDPDQQGRTLLAEFVASHRILRPVNLALLGFNPSLVKECPLFRLAWLFANMRHGRSTASLYGSQETTDRTAKTTEKLSA